MAQAEIAVDGPHSVTKLVDCNVWVIFFILMVLLNFVLESLTFVVDVAGKLVKTNQFLISVFLYILFLQFALLNCRSDIAVL